MKFRHEYKHCINNVDIYCLRSRLRVVMNYDSNCGDDGTYVVKSLYFDNFYDKALREKIDGVNKREKFRIRYYGNDTSFIRLEKKSKVNGLCFKESVPLTKEQCTDILCGNREFMAESENSLMREFYAKMISGRGFQFPMPQKRMSFTIFRLRLTVCLIRLKILLFRKSSLPPMHLTS